MHDSPEEEEEARERLAESLVAAALKGFERVLQPRALEDIRSYLVDELLCTSYGLARLRRLGTMPSVDASEEIVRSHELLSQLKKEGTRS